MILQVGHASTAWRPCGASGGVAPRGPEARSSSMDDTICAAYATREEGGHTIVIVITCSALELCLRNAHAHKHRKRVVIERLADECANRRVVQTLFDVVRASLPQSPG